MSIYRSPQIKSKHFIKSLCFLIPLALILTGQKASFAADWMYARDAAGDALNLSNQRDFDIFGIGIKDDGNDVWVGINSNMGREGYNISEVCDNNRCYHVSNGNIGWGDIFFDFSGSGQFGTSNDNRQLFGVNFTPGNDSRVAPGVYSNVYGVGVQAQNAGYRNLGRHYNSLPTTWQQQTTNVGDLAWNGGYWGERFTYSLNTEAMPNVIDSGNRIGDVTLLDSNSLYAAGFAPGLFQGSQLYGFKFSRSLLPTGDFIATLFQECLNDGIALRGRFEPPLTPNPKKDVPEPSGVVGFLMIALVAGKRVLQVKR